MPNPPMAQPANPTATGTASTRTKPVTRMPTTIAAWPRHTNRRAPIESTSRSWIQAPPVQARVVSVTLAPIHNVLSPRTSASASGTYASAPKNANVSTPRARTAAGRPARARNVPGGTSRRNAGTASTPPATTRSTARTAERDPIPARTRAAPAATRSASGMRLRSGSPSSGAPGPIGRMAGRVRSPAASTNGSSPRKTARQPNACSTRLARLGPRTPGTTHAVDSTANMRGRSASG